MIPAFCLSKTGEGPLKICGGVNKEKGCVKGFRKTLAIIYCEQTVNFDFSMDIGWNIGVEF